MQEKLLKEAGLKATPRRLAMLSLLLEREDQLAAEEIHTALSERCDLSTIYRALNTMVEHGLLRKTVCQDGVIRYRVNRHQHTHRLVCERCRRSIPLDLCPFEEMERDITENTGFKITGHRFELRGICPLCAEKEESE